MKYKHQRGNEIEGHLDIFIHDNAEEILIHGNPERLKSLAKLLIEIAELNQEDVEDKVEVIVGRLDGKGTKQFYNRYIPNDKNKAV
jgi:uridine phosphorylase